MRKATFILTTIAAAAIFTSCNKEKNWTCTCKVNSFGNGFTENLYGLTKSEAKDACEDLEASTGSRECELD